MRKLILRHYCQHNCGNNISLIDLLFWLITPKSSNNQRGVRRARQNKNSVREVTIMTPSMRFENKLARSSDATILRGKLLLNSTATTAPTPALVLHPSNFGARANAMSTIFSKFRIKHLGFKFICTQSPATFPIVGATGVLDDASATEGDAPTTNNSILELRCSALSLPFQTVPTEFDWSPVDKSFWYACTTGSSTDDPRFVFPGVLYAGPNSATATVFTFEIDYEIVFKGAIDLGSN
jgi:hypothetical protein